MRTDRKQRIAKAIRNIDVGYELVHEGLVTLDHKDLTKAVDALAVFAVEFQSWRRRREARAVIKRNSDMSSKE